MNNESLPEDNQGADLDRRAFLGRASGWSAAAIGAALFGTALVGSTRNAEARGVWINAGGRGGGRGGGWINGRGGGWGGGSWVNRSGGWINGGGWVNRRGGGSWVNW